MNPLSVFADPEHAPKVQEGAVLLSDSPLVQIKEVDVSTLQLDRRHGQTFVCKQTRAISAHVKDVPIRIPLAVTPHEKGERCSDNGNCIPPVSGFRHHDPEERGKAHFGETVFVLVDRSRRTSSKAWSFQRAF